MRRLFVKIIIAGSVAGLVVAYFPSLLYVAHLVGLTPEPVVQDVEIVFGPGWYPILSTKTLLGKLLEDSNRPVVVFDETAWPKPGRENSIAVTRYSELEVQKLAKAKHMISYSKNYAWGRADFMEGTKIIFVEKFGIGFSSPLSSEKARLALDAITEINRSRARN